MRTGLAFDPVFLTHDTGNHPENAGRLRAILARLQATDTTFDTPTPLTSATPATGANLLARLTPLPVRPATPAEITRVHTPQYLARFEAAVQSGLEYLDTPDCPLSPGTFMAALAAAGAGVEAVRAVWEGRVANAFVACRPPGHHAEAHRAMGFCYLNNIAVAAECLIQEMGCRRVLILDFDVHHGNGTQHHFQRRADVFYASIHQHPHTLYPGTGFAQERGEGPGLGHTLNGPQAPGAGDAQWLGWLEEVFLPAAQAFAPEFVLVSAGFDGHGGDPLAGTLLSTQAYGQMTRLAMEVARTHAGGRLVSFLEGGYDPGLLAESVAAHLEALLQG